MSDEKTQNLPDARSFEERIFARFDALESQIGDLRERLERLEQKSYDTKPIWERALAEILALGTKVDGLSEKVENIEGKVDTLASDLLTLRSNQNRLRDRMERLESNRTQ